MPEVIVYKKICHYTWGVLREYGMVEEGKVTTLLKATIRGRCQNSVISGTHLLLPHHLNIHLNQFNHPENGRRMPHRNIGARDDRGSPNTYVI
jgi:hypothetical protein